MGGTLAVNGEVPLILGPQAQSVVAQRLAREAGSSPVIYLARGARSCKSVGSLVLGLAREAESCSVICSV